MSKFPHGIMFHHFHDGYAHQKTQGSINVDQFHKIIKFIGKKNILNPKDFIHLNLKKKLKKNQFCLTFDDSLLCQYDIVLPYLEEESLKSFFFVYTSIFDKNPNLLELYRYFRVNKFKTLDEFYKSFFKKLNRVQSNKINLYSKTIKYYKKNFKFYTHNDILFRIYRDFILNEKEYKKIMLILFKDFNFKPKNYFKKIFMSKKDIKKIFKLGHEVGLHSHNHPTTINNLNKKMQKKEYCKNLDSLFSIIGKKSSIISMSHPCGRYNKDTFSILKNLSLNTGFISTMNYKKNNINSNFLIPRQDHANLISMINKK